MITRRRLLVATAAAGLALHLPRRGAAARHAITKPVPSTGEQVPVIGMGSSRTFDVGADPEVHARLAEVLRIFFARGGSLIDSSPMYGNAESVLGALWPDAAGRDALFAATKVWTYGREAGIAQMRRSLERMAVDRFDLMQIHNLRDWRAHLPTLRAWKDEGRIRYLGVTTSHGRFHAELARLLETEPFDFVQLSYSVGNREVEERLLPIARDRAIAVLANRPFQRGSLFRRVKGEALPDWAGEIGCTSWAQVFLKFAVSHPAVTCAIPATSKPHHMEDNMGASFGVLPDGALRRTIAAHVDSL